MKRGAKNPAAATAPSSGRAPASAPSTAALAVLLIVAIVATILIFVPGLLEQFETPKAEVVRVCGIAALAIALASGPRSWGRWQPLDMAVGACVAVEILATVSSAAPMVSLLGSPPQREGLLTSLGLAGIYAAARLSSGRPQVIERTFDALLAAAALASLYAIAQAAGLDPSPWRGTADYGAGQFRRPFGTLGHANLMGVVIAASLPAAWTRVVESARGGAWRRLVPPVLVLAVQLSLSRAAWLGAFTGSLVTWVFLAGERGRRLLRPALLPVGLAAAALVLGLVLFHAPLESRIAEIASTGGSGASRLAIWRGAIAAWRRRPVLGHGPDTFDLVFPRFQPADYWRLEWSLQPFHAHSIYLHMLTTRGMIGLLAGILAAVALVWTLRVAWRSGGAARRLVAPTAGIFAALALCGGFGALGMSGAVIACAAAGLLAGSTAPAPPGPGENRRALVAGLIAAAAVLTWATVELRAAWYAGEARERLDAEPTRAAAAASRATSLAPWEDTYSRMLAEALERSAAASPDRAATLAQAERAARRAVAIAPRRESNHVRLASVLAGSIDPGDSTTGRNAEAEFERALKLAPADGVAWMELARLELYRGRPRAALTPAGQAAALYPTLAQAHFLLAQARLALGDRARAIAELEQAMAADWKGRDDQRRAASELLDRLRAPNGNTR